MSLPDSVEMNPNPLSVRRLIVPSATWCSSAHGRVKVLEEMIERSAARLAPRLPFIHDPAHCKVRLSIWCRGGRRKFSDVLRRRLEAARCPALFAAHEEGRVFS